MFAQQSGTKVAAPAVPPPLALRQVSGIIIDSLGNPVIGATIKLISAKDSMATSTDKDGIYIYENVRAATFVLTVSGVGFKTAINKYLNNDQVKTIVIAPIVLRDQNYQLKQVNISGAPSILYKTDTVEYRASDYKVPPYATVDALLKRMEGMEVGADGTLVHNGQQVTKAKLNGKVFSGGLVAQAIQNLPASIVDKIQVVDDYGDQAARTGIKNGDPSKTLNITTRADKSIGTLVTVTSQEGNNDRYNQQLSVNNINANRQLNLIGNISSTVNGIASSTGTTASATSSQPGTTRSGSPTFSYSNTWNNNLTLNSSYNYNFNNTSSISNNYGQINSSIGPSLFNNKSTATNDNKGHIVKLEIGYNIGKFDYLQINPSFNYNTSAVNSEVQSSNLNYFTTGFEHPVVNLVTANPESNRNYGLTALYVHTFIKPKRNFSLQLGYTATDSKINGNKSADYRYYMDTTQNVLVKDSLSHLLTFKTSNNKVYRGVVTYVEPLGTRGQLEFTGQFRKSSYDNQAISDTVLANGRLQELARLDNIYNFSFTETRATIDYRYAGSKSGLTLGVTIIPTSLVGTGVDNNTGNHVSTSRSDIRVIPVLRYSYTWSTVERFQIAYSGTTNEPNFQQIQPFVDRSDPNNIIIGNPNLKPTFMHSITTNYNKYFPNTKFNISFNLNGLIYKDQVATNILQVTVPISGTLNRTINQITYVNLNDNKAVTGNYSISKQLNDRNYNLALNGGVTYGYANAISNNVPYHTTTWDFNERLGPRITLNDNKLMINPFVGYDVNKSSTNTLNATPSIIKTLKLAVDGQVFLPKDFQVHYDGSKNFISGFTNYDKNPLVINAGVQKRFNVHNQSFAFTFDVFDILHQNNFIRQTITPQSTTYTLSNTMSRYFLLGLKLNLQHWGGSPKRDGQPMKRRGDGSFIN